MFDVVTTADFRLYQTIDHKGRGNVDTILTSILAVPFNRVLQVRLIKRGAGIYANEEEAFASLKQLATIEPRADYVAPLKEAYLRWKQLLHQQLNN